MNVDDEIGAEYRRARELLATTPPDSPDYTRVLHRYATANRQILQRQLREQRAYGRFPDATRR